MADMSAAPVWWHVQHKSFEGHVLVRNAAAEVDDHVI